MEIFFLGKMLLNFGYVGGSEAWNSLRFMVTNSDFRFIISLTRFRFLIKNEIL